MPLRMRWLYPALGGLYRAPHASEPTAWCEDSLPDAEPGPTIIGGRSIEWAWRQQRLAHFTLQKP